MNNMPPGRSTGGGAAIAGPPRGRLICPFTRPGTDGAPSDKVIYAVPGVPYEMKEILSRAIFPDLTTRAGVDGRDPQPHPADLGRERVRPGRAPR